MSLFDTKGIQPMLLGQNNQPFDDPSYIFELKLDGLRCIAYLDPATGTDLRNKRDMKLLPAFPELTELHKQVAKRCILDGELIVSNSSGAPDFYELQKRSMMSNRTKIQLASARRPASFVAFDILELGQEDVHLHPLMSRKGLLHQTVREGGRLALSRYIETQGHALYALAKQQDLEGIVAKRKDSKYLFGRTAKDWIKIKHMVDDDYVVCGYISKSRSITSLILGQYQDSALRYKGHVTLGINREDLAMIRQRPPAPPQFNPIPPGNDAARWIVPCVCTVQYMPGNTPGLRQPVFKGLRMDKLPHECQAASGNTRI